MPTLSALLRFPWFSRPLRLEVQPRVLRTGLQRPNVSGRPKALLLSRALIRVRRFELGALPLADRRAALRNFLLAWAPFDDSCYAVAIRDDWALGFAWSRAAVDVLELDPVLRRLSCMPEVMLHQVPEQDGARLVRCLEGYELQLWRSGAMYASRWWAQAPDATEQSRFLRVEGFPVEAPALAPVDPAWQGQPWAEVLAMDDLVHGRGQLERWVVGAAGLCLMAFTGAQLSQLWQAHHQQRQFVAALEAAKQGLGQVVDARDRAISLSSQLTQLSEQMSGVQPLEVLQHLAQVLPSTGVVLKDFQLTGMRLRITLQLAQDVSRSNLVSRLQSGGWFTGVAEVRDSVPEQASVSFEMQLLGLSPLPVSASAAASGVLPGGGR